MTEHDERYPVRAPGWAAIDRLCEALYPGQQPHQFTSDTAYDLDSANPLSAISVWAADDPPHWHYVGYGLSELFEKSSPRPDVSGFGFELTMRIPRSVGEERPPQWPLRLLQTISHYVLSGHAALDSGHCIDFSAPLPMPELQQESRLVGVVCVPDPNLSKVETVHGSLLFLQLFGLTADELERVQQWDLERKVGFVFDVQSRGLTEPLRTSTRDDPRKGPVFRRYDLGINL